MKLLIAALTVLSLAASAGTALAASDRTHGKARGHSQPARLQTAPSLHTASCPPGLAKKSPSCIPPGQARKAYPRYDVGDRLSDDYLILRDPGAYRLDRNGTYAVLGDQVYRIDPETRKVLNLIGALADLAR